VAGGDLLTYPRHGSSTVWNQRGRILLHARPTERLNVDADVSGTYAFDPIGLARMGIFNQSGSALVATGRSKLGWRLDHDWTVAGLLEEHLVRFDTGTGAASHSPGFEATRRLGHRLETGGVYRFDYFQGFAGAGDARAHEAQGVLRYRWSRRGTLEVQAGPALYTGTRGETRVLPQAMLELLTGWRGGGARVTLRHGVGLGLLATPGLFDSAEAGLTTRVGRHFQFHADGGLWRSSDIPAGATSVTVYGVAASFDYRLWPGMLLGVGGSRFARLDVAAPEFERNILGIHVTWELRERRGGP
jgi:hypothetical protein